MKRLIVIIVMFVIDIINDVKRSIKLNKQISMLFQATKQGKTTFVKLSKSINEVNYKKEKNNEN